MNKIMINTLLLAVTFSFFSCLTQKETVTQTLPVIQNEEHVVIEKPVEQKPVKIKPIIIGAERFTKYYNLLKGKKVGIVTNQTGVITTREYEFSSNTNPKEQGKKRTQHTVDFLLGLGIDIKTIFAPEHGFRGEADAAELVKDGKDIKTGLPIISLYGKNKKPTSTQIKDLDILVFDIQDVGVRFYTYISTLAYVMEAAAENRKQVIVLDRPNPNINYVDGPILEKEHKSFLGLYPIPVVYGMTIGEYALMVNGEGWLKNGIKCDLTVIEIENYTRNTEYHLAVRPSPNLPNDKAINLYPSLGFFEGTTINAGRGTEFQFQRYGAPFFPDSDFKYKPVSNFGAKNPKHKNILCNGVDLSKIEKLNSINLDYLIDAYNKTPKGKKFFGDTFTIHAGTKKLRQQIEQGLSSTEIRASWEPELEKFKLIRKKYLIYKD